MDNILEVDKNQRYGIAESPLIEAIMQNNKESNAKLLMDPRKDYEMYSELENEMVTVSGAENLANFHRSLVGVLRNQSRKQDYSEIAPVAEAMLKIEGVNTDALAISFT